MQLDSFRQVGVTLLALALSVPTLSAGILVVATQESPGGGDAEKTTMQIDRDRIRVESEGPDSRGAMIFRGDRQVMWMIDYEEKTYFEVTPKDLQRMKSTMEDSMAAMRKQMEEQLKDLPPEQRRMVEDMMKTRMPPVSAKQAPEDKVTYTKVASGQRFQRWTCDKYEGRRGGEKVSEVCSASVAALGLNPDNLRAWRQLAEFFKAFDPAGAEGLLAPSSEDWEKDQGYPGIPVHEISYSDGKPESESKIQEIRQQDFSPSVFEIPAGFRKEAIPSFGDAEP